MTSQYKTDLAALRQQYQVEMNELRKTVDNDPGLNEQGKKNYLAQRAEAVNAKFKAQLDTMEARMKNATAAAKQGATNAIGKPGANTREDWERVTMLLDSGANLTEIVSKADRARLEAIQAWGPTYLEAQALNTRPSGLAGVGQGGGDTKPLMAKITQRWAKLLPNGHMVIAGAEAAGVEAGFDITAKAWRAEIDGTNTGSSQLGAALEVHYAEDNAIAEYSAVPISGE